MAQKEILEWISRSKINDKLDLIRERIGKDDPSCLHSELDEIFTYKPVDNYYALVRGELYFSEKRYIDASNLLINKDVWNYPGTYDNYLSELQYKIGLACNIDCNASNSKIYSYYIYLASRRKISNGDKLLYNETYIEEAKKLYEDECEREIATATQLVLIDFYSAKEKAYHLLDNAFYTHYNLKEDIQALVVIMVREKICLQEGKYTADRFISELETRQPNMGLITSQLSDNKADRFLLIADGDNEIEKYRELCKCLRFLGKDCILLDDPLSVELDYLVDIKDTVSISLENKEILEECTVFHPVELFLSQESLGTNTVEIVDTLLEHEENHFFNLITSEKMFRILKKSKKLERKINVLTEYSGIVFENFIGFGYVGDYNAYISRIYRFDYKKSLSEINQCQFSIVIPVKNSAYTLQYTLRTCLAQRGNIDYEIVISDNSDENNLDVKNLITSLHNDRIKYIRTPVNLSLAKSFEFAYGKARGEYIIPLGSDDGLLPWALETLTKIKGKYPEDNIIGWERGFFQWSESQNSQCGKLIIPRYYKKNEYNDEEYNAPLSLKEHMKEDAKSIFSMPLLYINSSFKRSFLIELYEKTGSIVDGYTQDIGMGIKSLLINDKFVFLKYPLTIAAISDTSLGGRMISTCLSDDQTEDKIFAERKQGFGRAVIESTSPFHALGSTECMFWGEIFKLRYMPGCREMLDVLLNGHNWKKSMEVLFNKLDILDVSYMKYLELLRHNAYQIDLEIGTWFDTHIYNIITGLVCKIDLKNREEAEFNTGFLNVGLTLDAKIFGVNTVDEAVELFRKIVNL